MSHDLHHHFTMEANGMNEEPRVTIGFCPRERFSKAVDSLASILENTSVPYRLIVVDCDTPPAVRAGMNDLLRGRNNVSYIRTDEYLLPADCKNRIIEETSTEFLCLIENDNLVDEGWVERFIASADRHECDAVVPLLYEIFEDAPANEPKPHFDDDLGFVKPVEDAEGADGELLTIVPRGQSRFDDPGTQPRPAEFMEAHCVFLRKSLLEKMKPLDIECSFSDEIDLSMTIREAGGKVIFDPSCTITYVQPSYPVPEVDRPYFDKRWDPEGAQKSHQRLMERWHLAEVPQLIGFGLERHARGTDSLAAWGRELAALAGDKPMVLVDDDQFRTSALGDQLDLIAFTENDGVYWGAPADDQAAIAELEKAIANGAGTITFTWNTFWWFDHYKDFTAHLRDTLPVLFEDGRMIVFALGQQ